MLLSLSLLMSSWIVIKENMYCAPLHYAFRCLPFFVPCGIVSDEICTRGVCILNYLKAPLPGLLRDRLRKSLWTWTGQCLRRECAILFSCLSRKLSTVWWKLSYLLFSIMWTSVTWCASLTSKVTWYHYH
jgi:hypothetical protein